MSIRLTITTANSIIGVSILAMPFCFKQCGILLALLMIILCGYLVKMACHLLIKSSRLSECRTYEFLAQYTFGSAGKLAVEVSMMGFMMGTCIGMFNLFQVFSGPISLFCFINQNHYN